MSSVISDEKCPRCGGVLCIEFDCSTLEEWKGCSRCGRRDGWHYIRDEEGNPIPDSNGQPQSEVDCYSARWTALVEALTEHRSTSQKHNVCCIHTLGRGEK